MEWLFILLEIKSVWVFLLLCWYEEYYWLGSKREREKDKKNDFLNWCLIGNVNSRDIDFFFWKIN